MKGMNWYWQPQCGAVGQLFAVSTAASVGSDGCRLCSSGVGILPYAVAVSGSILAAPIVLYAFQVLCLLHLWLACSCALLLVALELFRGGEWSWHPRLPTGS